MEKGRHSFWGAYPNLVPVVASPVFAQETKAGQAFNFVAGIIIPGPRPPIQLSGGDAPGECSLGGK